MRYGVCPNLPVLRPRLFGRRTNCIMSEPPPCYVRPPPSPGSGRRRALRPGLVRLAPSALAFAPRSPRAAGARANFSSFFWKDVALCAKFAIRTRNPGEGICLAPGGRGGQSSPGRLCTHPKLKAERRTASARPQQLHWCWRRASPAWRAKGPRVAFLCNERGLEL